MTMNEATAGTKPTGGQQPGFRASDAERERVVETLRKHYETGHIGYEEFTHRMERAYQATYTHELGALVTDLPGAGPRHGTPPAVTKQASRSNEKPGAVRVLAIIGLVIAAFVGLSWVGGLVASHPVLTLLGVAAIVWVIAKRPRGGKKDG